MGHLSVPRSKYMGHYQALLMLQIMVRKMHYLLSPTQQTLYIGYCLTASLLAQVVSIHCIIYARIEYVGIQNDPVTCTNPYLLPIT